MKYVIIILIALVAIVGWMRIASNTNNSSQDSEKKEILNQSLQQSTTTADYEINTNVALTGVEKIDVTNALKVEVAIAETMKNAIEAGDDKIGPYLLDVESQSYTAPQLDLSSLVVSTYSYSGGAHGNTLYETWTYGTQSNRVYELSQIIDQNETSAQFIFDKVLETAQNHESGALDDIEWITEGSGLVWSNYDNFYVTPEGITFIFMTYQIAPYAVGPVEVSVSWEELTPYLRGGFKKRLGGDTVEGSSSSTEEVVVGSSTATSTQ